MKQYWRAVLRRQWPVLTVAGIGLIGAVLVAAGFWRRGALMIGIGGGVAAAFRLLLPADRAGVMVVRSRMVDVSMMTVVCAVMVYIAWTIDPLGTS